MARPARSSLSVNCISTDWPTTYHLLLLSNAHATCFLWICLATDPLLALGHLMSQPHRQCPALLQALSSVLAQGRCLLSHGVHVSRAVTAWIRLQASEQELASKQAASEAELRRSIEASHAERVKEEKLKLSRKALELGKQKVCVCVCVYLVWAVMGCLRESLYV